MESIIMHSVAWGVSDIVGRASVESFLGPESILIRPIRRTTGNSPRALSHVSRADIDIFGTLPGRCDVPEMSQRKNQAEITRGRQPGRRPGIDHAERLQE